MSDIQGKVSHTRRIARLVTLFMIIAAGLLISRCTYWADSIEAWAIDADSGQPIEGLVVVAHWQEFGGLEGGNNMGQLVVMESVTDKNGHFAFPSWGPRIAWAGDIKSSRPRLLLYKVGYQPLALYNGQAIYSYNPHLQSDWNGKTIKFHKQAVDKKAEINKKAEIEEFSIFADSLNEVISDKSGCWWKKMPNMLSEIGEQKVLWTANNYAPEGAISYPDEYLIDNDKSFSEDGGIGCGSPKIFLTKK